MNNLYGVKKGQLWASLRKRELGRTVEVLCVDDVGLRVKCMSHPSGVITWIRLDSFQPSITNRSGFRLMSKTCGECKHWSNPSWHGNECRAEPWASLADAIESIIDGPPGNSPIWFENQRINKRESSADASKCDSFEPRNKGRVKK